MIPETRLVGLCSPNSTIRLVGLCSPKSTIRLVGLCSPKRCLVRPFSAERLFSALPPGTVLVGALSSLSPLFCSPAARLTAANDPESPAPAALSPSCTSTPASSTVVLWEEYGGVGAFAHAHAHHGVLPIKISENNTLKQRVLRHRFPPPVQLADCAGSSGSDIRQPSVLISLGMPCQPFAPGGGRFAEADPRVVEAMESVPRAVSSLGERYLYTSLTI
jgi:hypothetical protein